MLQPDDRERIAEVDIIRGFALLGICLVNIPEMLGSGIAFRPNSTGSDALIRLLYDMLLQTKFYTLFAFIFGVSFNLFMRSAERRGLQVRLLVTRRMLLLLMFGALHLVLVWFGDVLHVYSLLGFLLFLFYKRTERVLLVWGLLLLAWAGLVITGLSTLSSLLIPEELGAPIFRSIPDISARIDYTVTQGLPNLLLLGPEIVGLFLLGLYAGRKGWLTPNGLSDQSLSRWQWGSLGLSGVIFVPMVSYYMSTPIYQHGLMYPFTYLSGKTLAIFYLCFMLRLIRRWGAAQFQGLAAVGRMAFTNYLLQSVVSMLLLSWVWTEAGSWPLWSHFLYAILLFTLQYGLSIWWLRRYRMGPLEFLWRAGTYGRWPTKQKKLSVDP